MSRASEGVHGLLPARRVEVDTVELPGAALALVEARQDILDRHRSRLVLEQQPGRDRDRKPSHDDQRDEDGEPDDQAAPARSPHSRATGGCPRATARP